MMISDLPEDLVEEILSWAPATSLKRLGSTCKRWKALFKTPRFAEKHFGKAPKQSHVLMLTNSRLFPINVDLNVVPPSIECKGALDLKCYRRNSEQLYVAEVFHCDGLLLCITSDNRPVVCNSYIGETRWIQHKNGYKYYARFALGYGNNKSGHSYKILMYVVTEDPIGGFEIYEFSSNSWRVVNTPNFMRTRYYGVTLKGNAYWIAVDGDDKDDYLLSFDFTGERFRRLCLPSFIKRGGAMDLSVVREEKLSFLHRSYATSKMELWLTNKIDTEADLSWSKSFAMDLDGYMDDCFYPFTSLIIDEEKKVALCCNSRYGPGRRNVVYTIGEDGKNYTDLPYTKGGGKPFIFNYVPSLVQIQSN